MFVFFLSHKIQLIRFHYTPCVCVFQQMVICWSDLCIHWCIDWCMWNLLFLLRQQTVSADNKQFQQRTNSGQQSRWSCGAVLCYGLCARTTTSRCEISYEALLIYQNKHKILKTVVLIVCYYSSRVNNFQHLCGFVRLQHASSLQRSIEQARTGGIKVWRITSLGGGAFQ